MAETTSSSSSSSSSSSHSSLRTILIGVTTTVLGTAAVWYLGFKPKSSGSSADNFLAKKEMTVDTWKDYVSAENIFTRNFNSYSADFSSGQVDRYKRKVFDELDVLKNKIERLADTKDLDPTLVSLFERRIETNKQWERKFGDYLDNYASILNSNYPQSEQQQKLSDAYADFQRDVTSVNSHFINEIEQAVQTLSEKYGNKFSTKDLLMYQQGSSSIDNNNNSDNRQPAIDGRMLVGSWRTSDNATIYQYEDGKLYWYFATGDSAYGSWQVSNNILTHRYEQYYGAGNTYNYILSNVSQQSFTAQLQTNNQYYFTATRMNQ